TDRRCSLSHQIPALHTRQRGALCRRREFMALADVWFDKVDAAKVGKVNQEQFSSKLHNLSAPVSPLDHHSIAIMVPERSPEPPPVRIEGLNLSEAGVPHSNTALFPGLRVGHVEDKQILCGGSRRHGVMATVGELEVKRAIWISEHDAIKSLVVREAAKLLH